MCLPQKPWFYDIWQTWVGYPFQVSFLASGQWPPGIPVISPLEGVIHSSLFPHTGTTSASTRASCLFLGSAADCCRTSLGSGCAATPPSSQTTVISTHPGIKLLTADLISVPSFSAEPPHCSRPHGASRHSYFNNPAPSPCFLSPVLGRGQEYK